MRLTDVPEFRNLTHAELIAFAMAATPGIRLTLTQGTPVTTSDVTGATSVYAEPFNGGFMPLFRDAAGTTPVVCRLRASTVSLALGTLASATIPNDVFAYYAGDGDLGIEKLAWNSATARATAVDLVNGRYYKHNDYSRLLVGSFYPTATTTTEDSAGGTSSQVGGKRFLWNMYNRVSRSAKVIDGTTGWTYTSQTVRQANNASGNKVECVIGIGDACARVRVLSSVIIAANFSHVAEVGVGVNATDAMGGLITATFTNSPSTFYQSLQAEYVAIPAVGYNFFAWCERGADVGCEFIGDRDDTQGPMQSGLVADFWM